MGIRRIAVMETIQAESARALSSCLTQAAADETVSVVVLHGNDQIFCHGMDLEGLSLEWENGKDEMGGAAGAFADLMRTILFLPKPVIAEVSGEARGGGVGLAAACDGVVASRGASFGLPETLFGLIPAIIAPVLLQRLTPQKLRFLTLSSHAVDADQAQKLGLVDEVVDESELSSAVEKLARHFGRSDPLAVPVLKQFVEEVRAGLLAEALGRGATMTAGLLRQDRVRIAINKYFLEAIPPWLARQGQGSRSALKGGRRDDAKRINGGGDQDRD
jgi:enoyl-CoA hydratase/carnithine racemase